MNEVLELKYAQARQYYNRQLLIKFGIVPLSNLVILSQLKVQKAERAKLHRYFRKLKTSVRISIEVGQEYENEFVRKILRVKQVELMKKVFESITTQV